jgi:ABC-type transport system involved in cytochrome bd biosynthesis fused ATPase/permease subunit
VILTHCGHGILIYGRKYLTFATSSIHVILSYQAKKAEGIYSAKYLPLYVSLLFSPSCIMHFTSTPDNFFNHHLVSICCPYISYQVVLISGETGCGKTTQVQILSTLLYAI